MKSGQAFRPDVWFRFQLSHVISRKRTGRSQVTLVRALSKFGVTSRSQARLLIEKGRISVDGRMVKTPDRWVDALSATIALDGKPLRKRAPIYLAMNKPRGVVVTRADERGRATVYALLPEIQQWVFPIGRLDKETAGLLLFTNDTKFGERVTNPLEKVRKTYIVTLNAPFMDHHKAAMEAGMRLEDGTLCRPARVTFLAGDRRRLEVTIYEGKNRQIRRMCETLGYTVIDLIRTRIGHIALGDLPEGSCRPLSREEILSIKATPETPR
jgi:23S rRNA pseudouridine2605 synthase